MPIPDQSETDTERARRAAHAAGRITSQGRITIADLCEGSASVREALDTVGSTWSMMVLTALNDGPQRYGELKRTITGINDRMLTLTLQRFVEDGLAVRRQVAVPRNGVEYALTALGIEVDAALGAFLHTLMRLAPQVAQARATRRDSAGSQH